MRIELRGNDIIEVRRSRKEHVSEEVFNFKIEIRFDQLKGLVECQVAGRSYLQHRHKKQRSRQHSAEYVQYQDATSKI